MDEFRFDNAYKDVYQYDSDQGAYVYIGSYLMFDIIPKMSKDKKIERVKKTLSSNE